MKKINFSDRFGLTQAVLSGRKTMTRELKYPAKSHPNKSFKDLTGLRFGKLTVIRRVYTNDYRRVYWKCQCDCGKTAIVMGKLLKSGGTKSCGCRVYESKNVKHGLKHTRLYRIWSGIKNRCYCKTSPCFDRYGGRGIVMCDEWRTDFTPFYNWALSNGYSDDLSIDRIDVNGNYEPSNCRWATAKEQSDNKRCNILVTLGNETLDLQQWCDRIGIKRSTVNTRVKTCGWSYERALTTPVRAHKKYKERATLGCSLTNLN